MSRLWSPTEVAERFRDSVALQQYAHLAEQYQVSGEDLEALVDPTEVGQLFGLSKFVSKKVAGAIARLARDLNPGASAAMSSAPNCELRPKEQNKKDAEPNRGQLPSSGALPPGKSHHFFISHKSTFSLFPIFYFYVNIWCYRDAFDVWE